MKVVVGMSGGVDSSVAAFLLKEQGYDVTGITMKIYSGEQNGLKRNACYGDDEEEDAEHAKLICEKLGIPFYEIDLKNEYKTKVLDYFCSEYLSGRTPNPCVICNQTMKFGRLLEKVKEAGIEFDSFGTGHYAYSQYSQKYNRYIIRQAADLKKDQSYFLCRLSQEQIKSTLFPLGQYTKNRVREIAKENGFFNHDKKDSQNFFAGRYNEILKSKPEKGYIKNSEDKILGIHDGYWNFTVGQRKGLQISSSEPLYVLAIDSLTNTVYVGEDNEVMGQSLFVRDVNWIAINELTEPRTLNVKIRYAHQGATAVVSPHENNSFKVEFSEPQRAITPGQFAVFYNEDILFGGGIIV